MSRQAKVNCLITLNEQVGCFQEMISFLRAEKVIDMHVEHALKTELAIELPYLLYDVIKTALNEEKLQLVDYSWEILPIEKIRVTFITKHAKKDFSWNW